jgi:mannan endo-1,4-beta-mannosidase
VIKHLSCKLTLSIAIKFLLLILLILPYTAQTATFQVDGSTLRDPCGEPLVLRGVNAGSAFPSNPNAKGLAEVAKTGANAVRLTFRWHINRSGPEQLKAALDEAIANYMVAIPALWDATGNWDRLQFAVDYWSQPAMVEVLRKYEDMVLLNIANEAGDSKVTNSEFRRGYSKAIKQLRAAGLHMPLVIDAANWGRNEAYILDNAAYLLSQDPDKNLLFSWHPWDTNQSVDRYRKGMDAALKSQIPLIIGEFSSIGVHYKRPIDYRSLMKFAAQRDIGWLWWWWRSGKNIDGHAMTIAGHFGNWVNVGAEVAEESPYGIRATSKRTQYLIDRSCVPAKEIKPPAPIAPDLVEATVTQGTEVKLQWRDNADNEKHFDIQRWDRQKQQWRLIKVVGSDQTLTTIGGDLAFVYDVDTPHDSSLEYDTTYKIRVGAYISKDAISYSEPITVSTGNDASSCAEGNGLKGEYFGAEHGSQNFDDYDSPTLVRFDPTIDFDWHRDSPDSKRLPNNHFQVRWTGFIEPEFTDPYTLYIHSDDFARVWIGEQQVIDNWRGNAQGWAIAHVNFNAGQRYPIRVEYREWTGSAKIRLEWASSKLSRQIVPRCRLFANADGG